MFFPSFLWSEIFLFRSTARARELQKIFVDDRVHGAEKLFRAQYTSSLFPKPPGSSQKGRTMASATPSTNSLVVAPHEWAVVVREVAGIASHGPTLAAARLAGMSIVSVAWEDTGRASGSSGGPHITDVTLRLADGGPRLPIIRGSSNYEDGKTCDLKIEYLSVLVGNEVPLTPGAPVPELRRIPLAEYLRTLPAYVAGGAVRPMLAARDTVVLVSPQYCAIPVDVAAQPFALECFNYQSSPENPAVLYVFASVYGTSTQIVTERGAQTVMVNQHGRAHALQAMRLDEDRKARGKTTVGAMDAEEKTRNVMHLYQIPLKQQVVHRRLESKEGKKAKDVSYEVEEAEECEEEGSVAEAMFGESSVQSFDFRAKTNKEVVAEVKEVKRKGMIDAVLSIDPTDRGEFPVIRGTPSRCFWRGNTHTCFHTSLCLCMRFACGMRVCHTPKKKGVPGMPVFKRDERFPIRATAIKWKGTDQKEVPAAAFVEMQAGIEDYMRIGDASGSLVVDAGAELRATATFATKSDLLAPLAATSIAPSSSAS